MHFPAPQAILPLWGIVDRNFLKKPIFDASRVSGSDARKKSQSNFIESKWDWLIDLAPDVIECSLNIGAQTANPNINRSWLSGEHTPPRQADEITSAAELLGVLLCSARTPVADNPVL
jgi:hypothetical protein